MPELPEAETIARDLAGRIRRATVRAVSVFRPDILGPGSSLRRLRRVLIGRRILDVSRRGKNVVIELDGGWKLVVNLGMTGRLVASDSPRAPGLTHIAARLDLDDGRALLYDDTRRFGRLDLHDQPGWLKRSAELGVEPLSDAFTADELHRLTRRSITPIRNWLLDQRRIAGVGNIYANEALYRARVRPTRRARRLTRAQSHALHDALRAVLAEAVRERGTTVSDFRDASGNEGSFQHRLRVYDRAGQPCTRCSTPIRRIVLSNRSAFYCPTCQR